MMNAEQLSRVGEKLVKRCGSRDPFEIARQLGINVMLCENFGSLKGMYRVIKRNRFIFLNNSLDENMLRIVCAHELGHDQLHRNMAKTTPIHEFMLYDMKSKPEYEANIVAAEILMDSDEVLRYIYEYGYTAEQIASACRLYPSVARCATFSATRLMSVDIALAICSAVYPYS